MENLLSKQSESKSEAELLVNDMLDHIIGACLQFKPSFKLMAKEYNYPDAFAAEIAFVVCSPPSPDLPFYRHTFGTSY